MQQLKSFRDSLIDGQICIYDPDVEGPGNDWADQHVDQGFTWRPSSVSFCTFGSDDECFVKVWLADEVNIKPEAIRVIQVPFSVPASGRVVITNTYSSPEHKVQLTPGEYALVFEYGFREEYYENPEFQEPDALFIPTWCRLTFIPGEIEQAEILRVDADLSPSYPLLMEAKPA